MTPRRLLKGLFQILRRRSARPKVLSALGYNQNSEFAANGQFEVNVTKWAQQSGLYHDLVVSATAGLSRDNAAQVIFNALTYVTPVSYSALGGTYYTVGTSAVSGVVLTADQNISGIGLSLIHI